MAEANSTFLLGLDRAAERELEPLVGGPVAPFFALAQRCVWGVAQPDLVRVDVPAVLSRLSRQYPHCVATHLLHAFALAQSQPAQAAEAVERAREETSTDHPWAHLIPATWPPAPPEPALTEVIEGQVWRVDGFLSMAGTPFHIASTATVVRCANGELAFVNPCPLSAEVAEQVRQLGEVRWVISQGKAHSRYIDTMRGLFPDARILGTSGHLTHPASMHVRFDGLLDGGPCDLTPELERLHVEGHAIGEVVLLHRPSGCLILQDLVTHALPNNTSRGFGGFVYYFGQGVVGRIGLAGYNLLMWDDLPRLQAGVRRLLDSEYSSVVGSHWPLEPVQGDDLDALRSTLHWLLGVSALEHRRLQLSYFARQPGFLVDLIRYKRKQKQLARDNAARAA